MRTPFLVPTLQLWPRSKGLRFPAGVWQGGTPGEMEMSEAARQWHSLEELLTSTPHPSNVLQLTDMTLTTS